MRKILCRATMLVLVFWAGVALADQQQAVQLAVEDLAITTKAGDISFAVEIAQTEEERSRGLMFRRQLGERQGMLFWWTRPRVVSMWMRNTYIPLDMLFIKPSGEIVHIASNTVPHSLAIISSGAEVSAVLEVVAGTADRLGITEGDTVRHRFFDSD
jgi:uncharacterized membrane protein (UPF0127 family)